jgi:hypothetical protein
MRSRAIKLSLVVVAALLSGVTLFAQVEPPILPSGSQVPNWTVPPYRHASDSGSGGIRTMTDISDAAIFVAVTPCRVFDTRNAVGSYGGPRLIANTTRNFDIDSGPCTGIPAGSAAFSMNFGAILADGDGFITFWPAGAVQPVVSSINTLAGRVIANAAIVPANATGVISVFPNTGVHLYGDINGYFMDGSGTLNDNVTLRVNSNDSNEPAIYGLNFNSTSASIGVNGVRGYVNSPQNSPVGVFGWSDNTAGRTYGVMGQGDSGASGAAGVYGLGGSGSFSGSLTSYPATGVLALGRDANGINAFGSGFHSAGSFHTYSGSTQIAETYVGWNEFGTFGIYAATGNVLIGDNLTVSGTKSFAQPHPTDASKQIRYISVEAPKAEIFFRGSAQVERGVTRIEIPDEFRLVAKAGTYSAMVTPVGAMATVAVMAEDADGIVVQASRNVKINYVVYALREGYENHEAIEPNTLYQPMFEGPYTWHQNDHVMKLMRQNGTLNPDGTANIETVHRLGWTIKPESENPHKANPEPFPVGQELDQ